MKTIVKLYSKVYMPALTAAILSSLAVLPVTTASAQDGYPTRPIEIVVPYAPGGSSDVIARSIAPYLGEELGTSIVIQNLPGANTAVAAAFTQRADPDGYTVMLADVAYLLNFVSRGAEAGYDPIADFTPIAKVGSAPFVLFVSSDGSETLADFLTQAEDQAINISNSGLGGLGHLGAELLRLRTDLNIDSIPYQGSGPAMNDVVGGHVDAVFGSTASGMPLVDNGLLRALAVAAPERMEDFPDLPTFAEHGIEGVNVLNWWRLIGPVGLDETVLVTLREAMEKVVVHPEVVEQMIALGVAEATPPLEDFSEEMQAELELWQEVVTEADITFQ